MHCTGAPVDLEPGFAALASRLLAPRLLNAEAHMKNKLVLVALLGGCTVMVNGKPKKLFGSDAAQTSQPAPAGQPTPAAQPAVAQAGKPAKPDAAPVARAPQGKPFVVPLASLTSEPIVLEASGVFDTSWSKVFGWNSVSPNCGNQISSQPIASFEVTEANTEMTVAVTGTRTDGFIVAKGSLYWTKCDAYAMGPVQEGWQPGRYDIYPVTRYAERGATQKFQVELYNAKKPASWDGAKKLVISAR